MDKIQQSTPMSGGARAAGWVVFGLSAVTSLLLPVSHEQLGLTVMIGVGGGALLGLGVAHFIHRFKG